MQGLVASVVGLPLLTSAIVILLRHRQRAAHNITLAAVASTTLCTAALAFLTPDASFIIAEWLPGAGPMGLSAGASGLYVLLATTLSLFLVLLYTPAPSPANGILLLALAGANAALLADHFLLRYVALEAAALCILLAPAAEGSTPEANRSARGGYLLLRLGDAGLLAAILILWRAGGTLDIDSALEAGKTLPLSQLGWAAAGLVLAVWVKLGGYPFHLWSQTGQRLSLASQAWLYATVIPNLGLYLLYRVTPLLAHSGPVQAISLWVGAIGALLAAALALANPEPRAAMVHIGAAQGGLALVVAAAGSKPAVWLGLLALTPLRLLLFMATDTAQKTQSTTPRRIITGISAFGGLALAAFNLVTMWWTRENIPAVALFIAQVAAALVAAWAFKPCEGLVREHRTEQLFSPQVNSSTKAVTNLRKAQWLIAGSLSATILAGGLAFGPLMRFATDVTHTTPLATPTLQTLTASLPALLVTVISVITLWQLRQRLPLTHTSQKQDREAWNSEKGLARIAETLHAAVEITILERAITWVKRAVTDSANIIWIVEHGILEGIVNRSTQAVIGGAGIAHRTIEQEGLEGILRRAVSAALALGQSIQRWHTGRLRRNLLWVPVALALAILALVVYGS
jgi:formate hydrogenlyase subunit 3/multisubunit Na+/H+ antiporter MnhD subunit